MTNKGTIAVLFQLRYVIPFICLRQYANMKCNPRCTRIKKKRRGVAKTFAQILGLRVHSFSTKFQRYFVFRCSFYENPYGLCNKGAFDKARRKSLYETDLTKV